MNIEVTTQIHVPIADLWRLVADDFTGIQHWASSVVSAVPLTDVESSEDAPVAGRFCAFTPDPDGFGAREVITSYDRADYHLEFDFEPVNAPRALPVRKNQVHIDLRPVDAGTTELRWTATPELKAHGYALYPLLKVGLTRAFKGLVQELKDHAEAGRQNPDLRAAS